MEKRGKKISVNDIMAEVQLKDVKAFLLYYAKNDKAFEIAMKAHFISRIITSDPDGKYLRILNQVIKPRTLAHDKIGPTLKKTIKFIFQDFLYQLDDLLSTEDYKEAFYIVKNSLDKIAYLQNKYLIQDKAIEKYRLEFLSSLQVILDQNLAPKFRKEAEQLLIENIKKSYFLPKQENLIVLLDDCSILTETDKKTIVGDLLKKIDMKYDNLNVIKTMLQIAVPVPQVAKTLTTQIPHDKIFKCLVDMILERKHKVVEFYISHKSSDYSLYSEVLSCMALHEREEYQKLVTTLNTIDTDRTPILILREMIQQLSVQFLQLEFSNIKKWIEKLPFNLRCEILFKSEKYDLLIAQLKEKQDLDWLKVYDEKIIDAGYRDKIEELYTDLAMNYLEVHIGENANIYILEILHRLKVISEKEMLENLQTMLFEKYSHRKSLQNI